MNSHILKNTLMRNGIIDNFNIVEENANSLILDNEYLELNFNFDTNGAYVDLKKKKIHINCQIYEDVEFFINFLINNIINSYFSEGYIDHIDEFYISDANDVNCLKDMSRNNRLSRIKSHEFEELINTCKLLTDELYVNICKIGQRVEYSMDFAAGGGEHIEYYYKIYLNSENMYRPSTFKINLDNVEQIICKIIDFIYNLK